MLSGFLGNTTDNSFSVLEARFLTGDVNYDGYLVEGETATPSTAKGLADWYVEGRLVTGSNYYLGENFAVSPYLGVGYRFLSNHADEMQPGGYRRESTYFYVPAGAEVGWQIGNGWGLTMTGEFDWMVKGSQFSGTSAFGYLEPPYEDFHYKDSRNEQTKGFGLRGGLKIEKDFGVLGIFVEPFYRFWKIQNSKVEALMATDGTTTVYITDEAGYIQGLVEPFNITREYGVKIGISF